MNITLFAQNDFLLTSTLQDIKIKRLKLIFRISAVPETLRARG